MKKYYIRAMAHRENINSSEKLKLMLGLVRTGLFNAMEARTFINCNQCFSTDKEEEINTIREVFANQSLLNRSYSTYDNVEYYKDSEKEDENRLQRMSFYAEAQAWYENLSQLEKDYVDALHPGPPTAMG